MDGKSLLNGLIGGVILLVQVRKEILSIKRPDRGYGYIRILAHCISLQLWLRQKADYKICVNMEIKKGRKKHERSIFILVGFNLMMGQLD